MPKHNNLKICVVATSLSNGGTERFASTLSFMLDSLGYDVFLLSTKDSIDYHYAGQLYNLEKEAGSLNNVQKLICLYKFFRNENFDIIIDNRARRDFIKEFLIYRFAYKKSRIISMIHNYNIYNYFPGSKSKARLIYKSNNEFVGVSRSIKDRVISEYGFKNIKYIYNPVNLQELQKKANEFIVELPYQYILYYGRFEEESKNLTLMIKSYAKSQLNKQSVKLLLMGKGDDYDYLIKLVERLQLQDMVVFMDYNPNPFPYVKQALFTTLSSKYEGFPMSIIESLAVGTPVVSVDCDSGPNEVIKDRENGLLVKNYDEEALSLAFNMFLEDETLYLNCKKNASKSVAHLDVNVITKAWKSILENEA